MVRLRGIATSWASDINLFKLYFNPLIHRIKICFHKKFIVSFSIPFTFLLHSFLILNSYFLILHYFGAQGGNRTRTPEGNRILSPACLPIPPPGQINFFLTTINKFLNYALFLESPKSFGRNSHSVCQSCLLIFNIFIKKIWIKLSFGGSH